MIIMRHYKRHFIMGQDSADQEQPPMGQLSLRERKEVGFLRTREHVKIIFEPELGTHEELQLSHFLARNKEVPVLKVVYSSQLFDPQELSDRLNQSYPGRVVFVDLDTEIAKNCATANDKKLLELAQKEIALSKSTHQEGSIDAARNITRLLTPVAQMGVYSGIDTTITTENIPEQVAMPQGWRVAAYPNTFIDVKVQERVAFIDDGLAFARTSTGELSDEAQNILSSLQKNLLANYHSPAHLQVKRPLPYINSMEELISPDMALLRHCPDADLLSVRQMIARKNNLYMMLKTEFDTSQKGMIEMNAGLQQAISMFPKDQQPSPILLDPTLRDKLHSDLSSSNRWDFGEEYSQEEMSQIVQAFKDWNEAQLALLENMISGLTQAKSSMERQYGNLDDKAQVSSEVRHVYLQLNNGLKDKDILRERKKLIATLSSLQPRLAFDKSLQAAMADPENPLTKKQQELIKYTIDYPSGAGVLHQTFNEAQQDSFIQFIYRSTEMQRIGFDYQFDLLSENQDHFQRFFSSKDHESPLHATEGGLKKLITKSEIPDQHYHKAASIVAKAWQHHHKKSSTQEREKVRLLTRIERESGHGSLLPPETSETLNSPQYCFPLKQMRIWFSMNPDLFMNMENEMRLVRFFDKNPRVEPLYLVYSSKLLGPQGLKEKERFTQAYPRLALIDFDTELKELCHTTQDKKLYEYAAQELENLSPGQGGNVAAASDIVRLITPCVAMGIYSDFDVEINSQIKSPAFKQSYSDDDARLDFMLTGCDLKFYESLKEEQQEFLTKVVLKRQWAIATVYDKERSIVNNDCFVIGRDEEGILTPEGRGILEKLQKHLIDNYKNISTKNHKEEGSLSYWCQNATSVFEHNPQVTPVQLRRMIEHHNNLYMRLKMERVLPADYAAFKKFCQHYQVPELSQELYGKLVRDFKDVARYDFSDNYSPQEKRSLADFFITSGLKIGLFEIMHENPADLQKSFETQGLEPALREYFSQTQHLRNHIAEKLLLKEVVSLTGPGVFGDTLNDLAPIDRHQEYLSLVDLSNQEYLGSYFKSADLIAAKGDKDTRGDRSWLNSGAERQKKAEHLFDHSAQMIQKAWRQKKDRHTPH